MLRVALVMPVHNRRKITLQALASLHRIDRTGLDVDIVVVDDGSTDGTSAAIRREFPETRVIAGDGTLHYTAGTNRAIAAAMERAPDYVVAMNDDSIFHSAFLQRLVGCAEAHPRSIVGALLLLWNEPHRVFQVGLVWDTWFGGWRVPQHLDAWSVPATPWEVEAIAGNCVLYPAAAIREVGLMDEARFPYGFADAAYTVKMRKARWRLLIEPRARVWCEPNRYPAPLRSQPIGEVARTVFADTRHPLNLKRLFVTSWTCAPSRPQALLSFGVRVARMGLRGAGVATRWPDWPDPPIAGKNALVRQ
jgi:GT2 family glycosyltransferase